MKTRAASLETKVDKVASVRVPRASTALKVATMVGSVAGGAAMAVAYEKAMATRIHKTVKYLKIHLGAPTTAYLSGADDAFVVDRWLEGERPDEIRWRRLRHAYKATRCLVEAYDDTTARSWFLGMNPSLREESPARLLRNSRDSRILRDVVLAAREFAET